MTEFKKPRFILAAFFTLTTTAAFLFTEKMNSDQYITVMSIVLGLYSATVVTGMIKK